MSCLVTSTVACRKSPAHPPLVTSKALKHYSLYLIFCSLPAQFFNQSEPFVLLLRTIRIKIVVKDQTCQCQILTFFQRQLCSNKTYM